MVLLVLMVLLATFGDDDGYDVVITMTIMVMDGCDDGDDSGGNDVRDDDVDERMMVTMVMKTNHDYDSFL